MWFLGELIIGYVFTCQVHIHIFGRTGFMPSDCIALHPSDHRLCPSACVPTGRTPICVGESFHRSVNMFVRALSNDKSQELWTVCQIPDGSLEGPSAPRILDPEHAQVKNSLKHKGSTPKPLHRRLLPARGAHRVFHEKTCCRSFSINLLSHSMRGGIVENGRPNAAWKCQNQKSVWNSLHRIRNSYSDRSVMNVPEN